MRACILSLVSLVATVTASTLDQCEFHNQDDRLLFQCPGCQVHLDSDHHVTLLQGATCEDYEIPATTYADDAIVQLPGCQRTIHEGQLVQEQGATCKMYKAKPWKKSKKGKFSGLSLQGSKPGKSFKHDDDPISGPSSFSYKYSSSHSSNSLGDDGEVHDNEESCQVVQSGRGNKIVQCDGCQKIFDKYGRLKVKQGTGCNKKAKKLKGALRSHKKSRPSKSKTISSHAHSKDNDQCSAVTSPDGSKVINCNGCTKVVSPAGKTVSKVGPGCKVKAHKKAKHDSKKDEDDDDDDDDVELEDEKQHKKDHHSSHKKNHHKEKEDDDDDDNNDDNDDEKKGDDEDDKDEDEDDDDDGGKKHDKSKGKHHDLRDFGDD